MVIGVHSPEFAFEKDVANVRRAAKELRVAYPVAIDSDHVIRCTARHAAGLISPPSGGASDGVPLPPGRPSSPSLRSGQTFHPSNLREVHTDA